MMQRQRRSAERYQDQRWGPEGETPDERYAGDERGRRRDWEQDSEGQWSTSEHRRGRRQYTVDYPSGSQDAWRSGFRSHEGRNEGFAGAGHRADWDYGVTRDEQAYGNDRGSQVGRSGDYGRGPGPQYGAQRRYDGGQHGYSGYQPTYQGGGYEQGRYLPDREQTFYGGDPSGRSQYAPTPESPNYGPRRGGEYDYRGDQLSASRQVGYGQTGAGGGAGYAGGPDYGDRWWGGRSGVAGAQGQQQAHRYGRGPKGYRRSDDRIREEICDRMMAATSIDADEIEVSVKDGEVTLSGSVCCRADKFTAEQICEESLGVSDVINQLRVKRADASSRSESDSGRSETSGSGADSAGRRSRGS